MRYGLISKSKLLEEVRKRSYSVKSLALIESMPECDAIPVKFIKDKIRIAKDCEIRFTEAEILANLIAEWREY